MKREFSAQIWENLQISNFPKCVQWELSLLHVDGCGQTLFAIASRMRLKRIAKCILRSSRAICKQSLFARKHVDYKLVSCMAMVQRGPGSSVGIATGYGLDGPGIESRWGARFSAPVQTGPGAHPAFCTMGTESFPGDKERPVRDADPSPPSSAVVMKE
jgi:hypothetical protein